MRFIPKSDVSEGSQEQTEALKLLIFYAVKIDDFGVRLKIANDVLGFKDDVVHLKRVNVELPVEVHLLHQQSRAYNKDIFGATEKNDQDVGEILLELAQMINVSIDNSEYIEYHRVRPLPATNDDDNKKGQT
ncbi:hypothetical protein JTB14_031032 [Gonioctena quinquepunctata]|nr:hypothetical protein JTB14_031032 [Gonioctena quinquepunctata]